jgi:hypothetical protein
MPPGLFHGAAVLVWIATRIRRVRAAIFRQRHLCPSAFFGLMAD